MALLFEAVVSHSGSHNGSRVEKSLLWIIRSHGHRGLLTAPMQVVGFGKFLSHASGEILEPELRKIAFPICGLR